MKVERVTEADAASLVEIYAPYVENTAISFEYDVPSVDEFVSRIKTISSKYPYIKEVDDSGEILGYAYANNFKSRPAYNWAVETTIYVRNNERKKGVGRILYEELEKRLCRMGILNMNACIAYAQNEDEYLSNDSKKFHEAMGFTLVGRFHKCGNKFGRWYDMIWMEKLIGEHVNAQEAVDFNPD